MYLTTFHDKYKITNIKYLSFINTMLNSNDHLIKTALAQHLNKSSLMKDEEEYILK